MEVDIFIQSYSDAIVKLIPQTDVIALDSQAVAINYKGEPALRIRVYKDDSSTTRLIDFIFENSHLGRELKGEVITKNIKDEHPQDFDTIKEKQLSTIRYSSVSSDADRDLDLKER